MIISPAQLRAARAFLDWNMERAAEEAGIHRRTMVRLENDAGYVERQPASLTRLVEAYRARRILLEGEGLSIANRRRPSKQVRRPRRLIPNSKN